MVKKTIFILVVVLLLPVVLASTLEINIKTLPGHDVFVNVAEPTERYQLIESIKVHADSEGKAQAIFSNDRFGEVKIFVQVNKDGKKVMFENFGTKPMSSPLYLQLLPGQISEDYRELEKAENSEENETVVEENQTEETVVGTTEEVTEEELGESGITGAVVSGGDSWFFSKTTLWIAGVVIILAIVIVFVMKMVSSGPKIDLPKVQSVRSLPVVPKPRPSDPLDDELSKTEEEIEAVRSRIERIKKIKEAQRKLAKEREELRKLGG